MLQFVALFEPDKEKVGFVVTFPDFDWGVTQGDTEEEAAAMAADALTMIVGDYIEKGKPLPAPGKHRGQKYRLIQLPALPAVKAELYVAFVESGIRKAELARRLGISKGNVDRLFNIRHSSRIEQLDAAFRAIGKELTIQVSSAAA
jgi:antitoxin HicB